MLQTGSSRPAPGSDVITTPKMRADLEFLAGDALRGRLTDTPENAITLEWVASRFKWLGLEPMGAGGSYFLLYGLSIGSLGTGSNDLAITRDGQTTRYDRTTGFYPHRYSASATATGDLVFAHFGIVASALGYNDLGGDVRGKVLLVLEHEPGENDSSSAFDGIVMSEFTNPLKKALAAQARGAAAMLYVTDVQNHPGAQSFEAAARNYWPAQPPRLLPYTLAAWAETRSITGPTTTPRAPLGCWQSSKRMRRRRQSASVRSGRYCSRRSTRRNVGRSWDRGVTQRRLPFRSIAPLR